MLMTVHVCVAQAVCQATAQPTPLSVQHTGIGDTRSHPTNGNVDSLSLYAKAYARQSGQQLKVLGEAGFKYLSGAVENWRAAATDHGGKDKSPRGGLVLLHPQPSCALSLASSRHVTAKHSLTWMQTVCL